MNKIKFLLLIVLTLNIQFKIYAKGDLTRQNPVEIQVKMLGKSGEKHFFSPSKKEFICVLYQSNIFLKSK